jgi:hypothetical protein
MPNGGKMPIVNPPPDPKPQTSVDPVDDYVQAGVCQQMTQQFEAPAIFITQPDALAALKAQLGNEQPSYPYVFMYIQSVGPNTDSYMARRLARYGIPVQVNSDNKQIQTVKIFPTNFETEVTFISPKYDSRDLKSVKGFIRRWMMTARNGALNFNVNMGLSSLSINVKLGDSITIPKRESPADTEPLYQVVTNMTINGYLSEAMLQTRGRINQVVLADPPPILPGQQFFPFQ